MAIYMPNLVEAFTAIHACNRIGAIYTVLFSGFGEEAVAARLQAARASVVVVADASYRRGRRVPLLATLRAARGRTPTVRGDGRRRPHRRRRAAGSRASTPTPRCWSRARRHARGAAGPQRAVVPDLHQRHRVDAQGGGAQRGRVPARDVGQRALAGRLRGRGRLLGRRRRRLVDVPDPGRRGRAGLRHDDRVLRGCPGHPDDRAVLRDLRAAPGDEGALRPDAGADAAQVRRRPRRGAPAARTEADHDAGRAARRRHVHLDHLDVRRSGRQRLRTDRDGLDLDLPGVRRRAAQGRVGRHRGAGPRLRDRRRRRRAGTGRGQGQPRARPRRSRRWPGPCGTTTSATTPPTSPASPAATPPTTRRSWTTTVTCGCSAAPTT